MIKMLTSVAGNGFSVKPNENTDRFSPDEEKRYVNSGQAVYVSAQKNKNSKHSNHKK